MDDRSTSTAFDSLHAIVAPTSIAVIGAGADPDRVGGRVFSHLAAHFRGVLLPVNRHRAEVQGVAAVPSVDRLTTVPDLAVICVPAAAVCAEAERCADIGVGALLVLSSGFAESGDGGPERQSALRSLVERTGIRIVGPNCLGVVNVAAGVVATFSDLAGLQLSAGPIALVSQSGAFGGQLFRRGQRAGLRIGQFYSTGNEVDVSVTELLAHLVERDDVEMLLAVMEGVTDGDLLLSTGCRARALGKPLLCLKLGTSELGARAALSHTGAIVGSDQALDAAFRAAGILRPRRMDQMLHWARALRHRRRAAGNRLGIVTTSGGVGVLLADAATAVGLDVPMLPPQEQLQLRELLPPFAATANPVDCTGQVVNDAGILRRVVSALAASESIDVLCTAGLPDRVSDGWVDALRPLGSSPKPAVVWCGTHEWRGALADIGVPSFDDPTATVEAAAVLVRDASMRVSPHLGRRRVLAAHHARTAPLTELDAARLLNDAGIPTPAMEVARSVDEAARAADRIGYPVVIKALAHGLVHRSDVGGVVVGIGDEETLRARYDVMLAAVVAAAPGTHVEGVLVQALVAPGLEMFVGMRRDAVFGPVVSVGIGGVLVEVLDHVITRLAPLDLVEAIEAIGEIAGGRLVASSRGLGHRGQESLASIVVAVGDLAVARPDVVEIDLNPVIVAADGGATAVDLLVIEGRP